MHLLPAALGYCMPLITACVIYPICLLMLHLMLTVYAYNCNLYVVMVFVVLARVSVWTQVEKPSSYKYNKVLIILECSIKNLPDIGMINFFPCSILICSLCNYAVRLLSITQLT